MSHHSHQPNPALERMAAEMGLGAMKQFPQGKIHPTDEGGIRLAIAHADGKVLIHFGTPVVWIGFSREEALAIAATLIKHAEAIPQ